MLSDEQLDLWGKRLLERVEKDDKKYSQYYLLFLKRLIARIENNKDAIIFVGSEKGGGKSTFSITSALILRQLGAKFDFNSNIFYGEGQFDEAIKKISSMRKHVLIFDEMIDFGFSKNAMTRLNKNLVTLFNKARKNNHIIFMCMPYFSELDKSMRNQVNFWVEMGWLSENQEHDRRFSVSGLLTKSRNFLGGDKWGLDDRRYEKKRIFSSREKLGLMQRLPSFICYLASPALPKIVEDSYQELSHQAIVETGQKILENTVISKPNVEKKVILHSETA